MTDRAYLWAYGMPGKNPVQDYKAYLGIPITLNKYVVL